MRQLLYIVILLVVCSCRATHEVERVEVPVVVTQEHTTQSVKIDHIRDTLIQRDSVYYYVKGDTVQIERWHYLQGTTNVVRVDTLVKTDSIEVPVETMRTVETVVEVPRPLSWWQKTLMIVGGMAIIAMLLLIAYKTRKR